MSHHGANAGNDVSYQQQEQLAAIQPHDAMEALAQLAATLANTHTAFVSIDDDRRQKVIANVGLDAGLIEHFAAFCSQEATSLKPMVVQDVLTHPAFKDNALVTGAPHSRFFAAFPLTASTGEVIGTLGLIDFQRRIMPDDQLSSLADLAVIAANTLEARRNALNSTKDLVEARKKAADVERTRNYYRSIFNACNEAIASYEPIRSDDGEITDFIMQNCNNAACVQRGLTRDEMLGRTIRELVPNLSEDVFQRYVRVVETGDADQFDNHYNDGHYDDWFRISAARNSNGGLVLLLTIITEQKKTELQLRRSRDALSSFTAAVSHDLRTPLGHISGFIELIDEDLGPELSEQNREYMQYVTGGVTRMRQLIDAMQKHARLGRIVIERETVDLHDLVERIVAGHRTEIDGVDAKITLENLPALSGDPVLIDQLFSNLLGNALRYRHEMRDLRVTISGEQTSKGQLIRICDNGIGIDPKLQERVFTLFERAVPQTFKVDGLGLGLAMCRAIAKAHGGSIHVEPQQGAGTCFRVFFPSGNGIVNT